MTIPSDLQLPIHSDKITSTNPKDLENYMRELVRSLERSYEQIAQGINGNIKGSSYYENEKWIPVVKDTANAGTTFTYDHQIGWVFRQGIFTDCWFDVEWTAASGATSGNMYVELPYQVAVTEQKPFVGVVQPSVFTFTGGTECVINAISDTYRGEIWNCGNGFTTANQKSRAAGHLIGHIRYIGKADE